MPPYYHVVIMSNCQSPEKLTSSYYVNSPPPGRENKSRSGQSAVHSSLLGRRIIVLIVIHEVFGRYELFRDDLNRNWGFLLVEGEAPVWLN